MEIDIAGLIRDNGRIWKSILEKGLKFAEETKCRRKGVNATAYHLASQQVIASFTNGPLGAEGSVCSNEIGNCGCAHAEVILLSSLMRDWSAPEGGMILLGTYSPCMGCANAIVLSGLIEAVIYLKETEHYKDGKDILKRNGILVYHIDECDCYDHDLN